MTLVATQRPYGSRGVSVDGDALADRRRRRSLATTRPARRRPCCDDLGDAAGPRRRGRQRVAHLEHAAAHLVDAELCRRPTSSGPAACCRGCRSGRTRAARASIVGSRSSRAVKSSSASAGCGLAPRPPAMYTRKPGSTAPSSSVRVVAITPTSLNIAWPQSVEQPEKLILNLRGRRWPSGLRTKWRNAASAHGVTSRSSCGQAPARWQAITLRTVSPHASRVVRPTDAEVAHHLGDLASARRSASACSGGW